MTERYTLLEQRYLELERMYEQRPSRPEDVERIQLLERDVEMKDALIQKTLVRCSLSPFSSSYDLRWLCLLLSVLLSLLLTCTFTSRTGVGGNEVL